MATCGLVMAIYKKACCPCLLLFSTQFADFADRFDGSSFLFIIHTMATLKYIATATAFLAVAASAADDMGPAAFMWPEDRVWSGAVDNTGPCGSVASVGNRTSFPLSKSSFYHFSRCQFPFTDTCTANGNVALIDQDEAYRVELSISYMESKTYPS